MRARGTKDEGRTGQSASGLTPQVPRRQEQTVQLRPHPPVTEAVQVPSEQTHCPFVQQFAPRPCVPHNVPVGASSAVVVALGTAP